MKAVILAGQDREDLYPLTVETPLALLRICSKPMLEHMLGQLGRCGVTECIIAAESMQACFAQYLDEREPDSMALTLVGAHARLGAAGAVKEALGSMEGGEFLILREDVLFLADLSEAIRSHRASGAHATIISGPRGGGDGAVYLLDRTAFELVPDNEAFDFETQLFARMRAVRRTVRSFQADGFWQRIDGLDSYRLCQYSMIREQGSPSDLIWIGANVAIGEGARIIGPCVLGDNVTIGAGARIKGGIFGEGAYIGPDVFARQAIVGPDASVKAGAVLLEGCAIGAGAAIGARALVGPDAVVWPRGQIPGRGDRGGSSSDNALQGEIGVDLTPEAMARLGRAIGSIQPDGAVAIACDSKPCAEYLKMALASGILSTGAAVTDFGVAYPSLFTFCMTYTAALAGVFVSGRADNGEACVQLAGLPAKRVGEIKARYAHGGLPRSPRCGRHTAMEGMQPLYALELLRCAPYGLHGVCARVRSENHALQTLLESTLQKLGCNTDEGPLYRIDGSGASLQIAGELADGAGNTQEGLSCICAVSQASGFPDALMQAVTLLALSKNPISCPSEGIVARAEGKDLTLC